VSTLSIETVDSPTELFNLYPNQHEPQDCFIQLNLSSGRMSAGSNPEIGNAVPMDVWHGLERRYSLPGPILASVANTLMEDIASHAQSVLDHAEVAWDGSNNVVRTHERNCEDEWWCHCPVAVAERAIEAAINGVSAEDYVSWAEAGDWYTEGADEYVARVQAGESIDDVAAAMEREIEDANKRGHSDYWWVVEGIGEYLEREVEYAKAEKED